MPISLDQARLERVLMQLSPDDAAWLSQVLEPPSTARQRRLALRDEAIRELAALLGEPRVTVVAKTIARELGRYVASGWRIERDLPELPPSAGARRVLLHRIARLNAGGPLAWRSIFDVLRRTADAPATAAAEGAGHATVRPDKVATAA